MSIFKGSGVAIITPFKNGNVNYIKLRELLEWQIKEKTDAIIICGTTGEASTMSRYERKKAIKFTVDVVDKRVPVIAGTGNNDTLETIRMSQYAESVGVDGLLVITPYYNKTNVLGLIKHFQAIDASVKTPIILYNVPSRTGMNITPKQLEELSKLKNVVAIKEASGDIGQVAKMKEICKDTIDIYSGNDDQVIPIMSLGGSGVISVSANIIPNIMHEMTYSYLNKDTDKALDLQLKYLNLINNLFIETNPIPVKTALNLMGFEVGNFRLPLYEMNPKNLDILKNSLKEFNLIKED